MTTRPTLPKYKIDYSKADSGEAPFDGGLVILHINSGYDIPVIAGYFHLNCWVVIGGSLDKDEVTHWSPLPEFVEGGSVSAANACRDECKKAYKNITGYDATSCAWDDLDEAIAFHRSAYEAQQNEQTDIEIEVVK